MGLGIITLFFLVCFSILYVSKGLENKPEWLAKAADSVGRNAETLAFYGLIYSLIAALLSPVGVAGEFRAMLAFLANAVLFLLVLPYALDHLLAQHETKVPAGVARELKNIAAAVTQREKTMGYIGAGFAFVLFIALFR